MEGETGRPASERHHPKPQRLSALRLFGILVVFAILAGYAIWESDRFQNLVQGVSQSRLSAALGVPVTFRRVKFRALPPSVSLAAVRIGNDPALSDPHFADQPLLTVEELFLGGGVSLAGRELRLGRVRAVAPRLTLVQLPDGSFNIPPGLKKRSKGGKGLKLVVEEILAQQGTLEFNGRKLRLDGRLEDFVLDLERLSGERYRGTLSARKAVVDLRNAEPIVMRRFDTRFFLYEKGLTFDSVNLSGPFGEISATGRIENFDDPKTLFALSGKLLIEEVERVFHSDLGFAGEGDVRARLELPPEGGFRVTGRVTSPRVDAQGFVLEDLAADVVAVPESLLARIERTSYAGGEADGVLGIADLQGKRSPMTLALHGEGISVERFFADLDLPGTGLSGAAEVTLALTWGKAGIDRANGGGMLSITPGEAVSAVRGRYGLSVGGGGAVSVVDGGVRFEGTTFEFPQSTLELAGGFRIGEWRPDYDFRARSRDLTEFDRLFQNFVAATGGKSEPLGAAGVGEIQGHLSGTWSNPEATVELTAEDAKYAGVLFGDVKGTVDVRDGAFFFRPLSISDAEAALTLEGMAAYREVRGRPRFDLAVAARGYPLSRLLDYLDFDYPVEGRVTGSFPIKGSPEALSGGGPVELTDAVLWGQKVLRITGNVLFTPGRFALEDVSAALDGGEVSGDASVSLREETFEARLTGKAIPIKTINLLEVPPEDLSGTLSFTLEASGTLEKPSGTLTASLAQASFFHHPVPEGLEPRLEANLREGVVDAVVSVPEKWSLTARGDLFGDSARIELALDAKDVASLLLFTPLEVPPGRTGALAVSGHVVLPQQKGGFPTGAFTVTRARLDQPDRPGVLAISGEVRLFLEQERLRFDEFQAVGEGTALKIGGYLDLGERKQMSLSVSGPIDASLIALAVPEVALTGRLRVDVKASGPLGSPSLNGNVSIENGKYRLTGLAQIVDDIDGSISFQGTRGEIDGLRAKFGGGEVYAAGSFRYEEMSLKEFRVTIQGRRVALRYPEDMRLQVDADLVATGGAGGKRIRGEVVLLRGTYSRDFEVSLADLLERTRPSTAVGAREPWKEETSLEVRIVSSAALEVKNNLASLTATVDLLARGTVADPTLIGQVLLDEGGRITFRDVRYEIESGTITFAGRQIFAPIVDVRARAEVKGYDLVVSLVGTWPRLQTTFSSDPPLPDDTVIALLLTGSGPSARSAGGESGSLVSTAGNIVAGAAIGGITRQGQRLLKLDRFEIDPVFSGSQIDLRYTVGKQITPDISVLYSQSLNDSSEEPIYRLEWRITDTIVLRGRLDENGVYLLDIRRRKRF